jgi:hypothetical protein
MGAALLDGPYDWQELPMIHVLEMGRVPTEQPLHTPRRRPSRIATSARLAAVLLLFTWLGPVTMTQTDAWQLFKWAGAPASATASASIVAAGDAVVLESGVQMRLSLRDGSVVHGRFLGRTLLDPALYAPRFESRALSAGWVPFALGETLRVSLRDGRKLAAPFSGYGELSMLFASLTGGSDVRIPFEFAKEIRRADGERIAPKDLIQAFKKGTLPSREALALGASEPLLSEVDEWAGALRVAVEDIASATAQTPSGSNVAGTVVLAVLLTLVLFIVLIAASFHSSSTSCSPMAFPDGFGGLSVRFTDRPFDRSRGCYEGEPPLAAAAWPGDTEVSPTAASAEALPASTAATPR